MYIKYLPRLKVEAGPSSSIEQLPRCHRVLRSSSSLLQAHTPARQTSSQSQPSLTPPPLSLALAELPKTLLQNVLPLTVISVLGTPPHVLARSSTLNLSLIPAPKEIDLFLTASCSPSPSPSPSSVSCCDCPCGSEQDLTRRVGSIL